MVIKKKNKNIKFWDRALTLVLVFQTVTFYCKAISNNSTRGYLHARLRSADILYVYAANQSQAIKPGSRGILVTFPSVRKPIKKKQKNEYSVFVCPCVLLSAQRSLRLGEMALTSSHAAKC